VLLVNQVLLVHVEHLVNPVTQVKKVPKVKLVRWVLKEESPANLDFLAKTDHQVKQVHVVYLVKMENQANADPKVIKVTMDQLVPLDCLVLPELLVNKVVKDRPVLLVRWVLWVLLDSLVKTVNPGKMVSMVHLVNPVLMVSREQVSVVHLENPVLLEHLAWTGHVVSQESPADLVKMDEKVKQLLVPLVNLVSLVKLDHPENPVSLVRMVSLDVMQS